MRFNLQRVLIAIIVLVAVTYAADYFSVRYRMAAHKQGNPFDQVTHPHLLAIPQKGNRVEYALDAQSPMISEPCVHSLFPHFGYTPCWYITRMAESPTTMFLLPAVHPSFEKPPAIAK